MTDDQNVEEQETPLERAYRLGEGCGALDAAGVKRLVELDRENAALGQATKAESVYKIAFGPQGAHGYTQWQNYAAKNRIAYVEGAWYTDDANHAIRAERCGLVVTEQNPEAPSDEDGPSEGSEQVSR